MLADGGVEASDDRVDKGGVMSSFGRRGSIISARLVLRAIAACADVLPAARLILAITETLFFRRLDVKWKKHPTTVLPASY